jgi:hypothetical protein
METPFGVSLPGPDQGWRIEMYFGTYERLGVSVFATTRVVLRVAQRKLKKQVRYSRQSRDMRHEFYRELLKHHKHARELVEQWRL